jgi:hypothetical protein
MSELLTGREPATERPGPPLIELLVMLAPLRRAVRFKPGEAGR